MSEKANELNSIITRFSESGWDLIEVPAKAWLAGERKKEEFIGAVEQADRECGNCGCEFDPLYKKFLAMKDLL